METLPKKDFLKIGFLKKLSGVRGEIVLQFEQNYEKNLREKPILFFELDNLLVPWFISNKGIHFRSDTSAVIKIDWMDSKEQSQKFIGTSVYIHKKNFEEEEEEEEKNERDKKFPFTEDELYGFSIVDEKIGIIGTIEKIENYSGNILFQVNWNGSKILLPFHEDFFIRLDKEKKIIILHCPEGILNIN